MMKSFFSFLLGSGILLAGQLCLAQPDTAGVAEQTAKLEKASAEELAHFLDGFVTPGKRAEKNDSKARMALYNLVFRAGADPALKARLEVALLKKISVETDGWVRAFLLDQLQPIAGEGAVAVVAPLLKDKQLFGPAARVLVATKSPGAGDALKAAVPESAGATRLSLYQALFELGIPVETTEVAKDLQAENRELRCAALALLSVSPTAEAGKLILENIKDETGKYLKARGDEAYLGWLRRFAAVAPQDSVARGVEFAALRKSDPHIHCAVLEVCGIAGLANDFVYNSLVADTKRIRLAAARSLHGMPAEEVKSGLVSLLDKSAPEKQVDLLDLLGKLKARSALPAIRLRLEAEDRNVQVAAIRNFARIDEALAFPVLLKLLGNDLKEIGRAAHRSLVNLQDGDSNDWLAKATREATPEVAVALIQVISERLDSAMNDTLVEMTTATDETVRIAAFKGLEKLAAVKELPVLLERLGQAKSKKERQTVGKTLKALCRRTMNTAQTTPPTIAAFEKADLETKLALLDVFTAIGGEQALAAVQTALTAKDGNLAATAVRAISNWPDGSAMPTLLEIAKSSENATSYVLALRGYGRLLEAERLPSAEKLARYKAALGIARRPDEKRFLISKIGNMRDRSAFPELLSQLNDAALENEAGAAIIQLAKAVRGNDSIDALVEVVSKSKNQSLLKRAKETLSELAKYSGCVATWEVSGPYEKDNKGHTAIYSVPFPPEDRNAKDVKWFAVTTEKDGHLNLLKHCGKSNRCAYMRVNLLVPEQTEAIIQIGSDDGVKGWLNGNVFHENNVPRGYVWCEDSVPVVLLKGVNTLMLKITQGGGGWEANARIRNWEDLPIKGMNFELGEPVFRPAVAPQSLLLSEEERVAAVSRLAENGKWQVLFNMKDLDNWMNSGKNKPAGGWRIEKDLLRLRGKGGYIWTRERFADFEMEFDYNTSGNSGFFFRVDNPGDPVQTGLEMQVNTEDTKGKHGVGAFYDMQAPSKQTAKKGWNHVRFVAKDNLLSAHLNGVLINQLDLNQWTTAGKNPDGSKNKYKRAVKDYKREGHIGFQDHGAGVSYRNLRIRRLK